MKLKHPMQPIYLDKHGTARFHPNKIIQWLFETGKLDLNLIATMPMKFSRDDQMQIAQLLGYSVSGFGGLSYASREVVAAADLEVEKLLPRLEAARLEPLE